jgi:hypothetical protein
MPTRISSSCSTADFLRAASASRSRSDIALDCLRFSRNGIGEVCSSQCANKCDGRSPQSYLSLADAHRCNPP